MIPVDLLLAAVAAGKLIGLVAPLAGEIASWVGERRTDRLAR